jgi:hypothetical protein
VPRIDVQCGEAAVRGEPSPAPMVICVQIRSPQLGSPPVITDRARPR